jgi:hypothetical protein
MSARGKPVPIFERDGRVEALVVGEVMLFFEPDRVDDDAVQVVYQRCYEALVPQLRHFRAGQIVRLRPITRYCDELAAHWCRESRPTREPLYIELTSGLTEDEVGPWSIRMQVPRAVSGPETAALRVTWPASVALQHPQVLRDHLLATAAVLSGAWGSAGLATEFNTRRIIAERDDQLRIWTRRYRCVVHRDFDHSIHADTRCVPPIAWLNLLPEGVREQRADLPAMLRGSEAPQLGDRNRNEDVSGMRHLQAKLADYACAARMIPPGFEADEYESWLRRFETED